jgi:hypothetical protein
VYIWNLSNKEGKFSPIKIGVTSIHIFSYLKDKVTIDGILTHVDKFPEELPSSTEWVDFTDTIVGTFVIFGQQPAYRDLADDDVMAKLTHLGSRYKLRANIAKDALDKLDDILNIIEDVKTPDKIKKNFNPTWDEDKSLPIATSNNPFGTMAIV